MLFRQPRIGREGKTFQMLKFRSMVVDAEARLEALRDQNESDGAAVQDEGGPADHPARALPAPLLASTSCRS